MPVSCGVAALDSLPRVLVSSNMETIRAEKKSREVRWIFRYDSFVVRFLSS